MFAVHAAFTRISAAQLCLANVSNIEVLHVPHVTVHAVQYSTEGMRMCVIVVAFTLVAMNAAEANAAALS